MIVLGMSRRASLVRAAVSRRTPPGSGRRALAERLLCSSLSRRDSPSSSIRQAIGFSRGVEGGILGLIPGRSPRRPSRRSAPGPVAGGVAEVKPVRCARRARRGIRGLDVALTIASTWSDSVIEDRSAQPTRARQRQSRDLVAVGPEGRDDVVPRPGAEPESGDQDDRCGRRRVNPIGAHRRDCPPDLEAFEPPPADQAAQARGREAFVNVVAAVGAYPGDGGGCAARQRCARRPSAGDLALNRAPSDGGRTAASHLASRLDDGTCHGRNRGRRLASVAFVAVGRPGRGRAALGRTVRRAG